MTTLKFKISDTQYLKINVPNIDKQNCCNIWLEEDFFYVDESKNICIPFAYQNLSDIVCSFIKNGYIQSLIDGKDIIDDSIVDLGFEYNQSYNNGTSYKFFTNYWFAGNSHKQERPYYGSWFYNDKDGNIIFEITPFYPWYGVNKRTQPDRIPYKQWIKDYKIIVRTIIPKENIATWIDQAKELKEILDGK